LPAGSCLLGESREELARFPHDPQTIKDSADLYVRKGNYARAATLRRRCVGLDPEDANSREELGEALLLNREFEAAQRTPGCRSVAAAQERLFSLCF